MAKGRVSAGSGILEFWSVLLFKVAPLVAGLILALQISDIIPFDLTQVITIEGFFYVYIVLIIAILSTLEARSIQRTEGGGIAGATFAFWVSMIIAIGGYVLASYILLFNYMFNDSVINTWISVYLFLGVILIFINSREQIFFSRAILRALRN